MTDPPGSLGSVKLLLWVQSPFVRAVGCRKLLRAAYC